MTLSPPGGTSRALDAARFVRPLTFVILLALLAPVVLLANVGLPFSAAGVKEVSGGVGILDLEPRESAEGVYRALAAYGEEGRERYLTLLATLDLLFPPLLALTCALAAALGAGRVRWWIWPVPVAALVADYTENVVLVILLTRYPGPGPAAWLPALTTVKTAAAVAEVVLAVAGLVYAAVRVSGRSGRGFRRRSADPSRPGR
ncbi:hypothetical protein ACFFMN_09500 [Planobispora siamensis]|uniref:Uncharacterized protein n=1 Tax=Planobispora siamensis TaxID=936338 RepID=A0A8J3SB66_9ACTN|nr:hypothetical protein [Planobispora siamensis]GIH91222.1 hypothetical protein Psi01_18520 [Planobispora siamensis]